MPCLKPEFFFFKTHHFDSFWGKPFVTNLGGVFVLHLEEKKKNLPERFEPSPLGWNIANRFAADVAKNRAHCLLRGQVCSLSPLPDDLFVCGFPCRPFSTQRPKRFSGDHEDARCMFDTIDVLKAHQPRLALLENVMGFLPEARTKDAVADKTFEFKSSYIFYSHSQSRWVNDIWHIWHVKWSAFCRSFMFLQVTKVSRNFQVDDLRIKGWSILVTAGRSWCLFHCVYYILNLVVFSPTHLKNICASRNGFIFHN